MDQAGHGAFPGTWTAREGPRAQLYRDFAAQVAQATGLEPVLWDERRTTVDAHRILAEGAKMRRSGRKPWTRWPLR